ncbi:MAG: hypothetical protein ACRDDP_12060, partial [Plesiomonas sp.]
MRQYLSRQYLARAGISGRQSIIAAPYLWLLIFFLIPFLIVFKISFAEMQVAIPPYTDLLSWLDGKLTLSLNLANYSYLVEDPLYVDAYLHSLR